MINYLFHINVQKTYKDKIFIESVIRFSGLSELDRHTFLFDLRLKYQNNVSFDIEHDHSKVKISKVIFYDSSSRDVLVDIISALLAANRATNIQF
jgi:hypothetical protein